MSDSLSRVREIAEVLGLTIADDRLAALAHAWEQALQEAESVRMTPTPMPTPAQFDPAWSKKR